MMKRLFFMLLTVLAVLGCENEKEGGDANKAVILTGDTQANQTVYADQTSGAIESIKFKAAEAWYANVSEMAVRSGGSETEWLTLDAYSGGAGEHALTMTLKENYTGSDRKAEIKIFCGEIFIIISVEQKAVTSSGEKPEEIKPLSKRLVKRIVKEPNESQPNSVYFEYDGNSAIMRTTTKDGNSVSNTSTFKVSKRSITEGMEDHSSISYGADESGCIVDGVVNGRDPLKAYDYTYSGGYMTAERVDFWVNDQMVSDLTNYVWENGRLKSSRDIYKDSDGILQCEYEYQATLYDRKANFCLYRILTGVGMDFQVLDHFGRDIDFLITKITSSGDKWNKDNGVRQIRYEKDSDGYVTKIYERWTPAGGTEEAEYLSYEIEYY